MTTRMDLLTIGTGVILVSPGAQVVPTMLLRHIGGAVTHTPLLATILHSTRAIELAVLLLLAGLGALLARHQGHDERRIDLDASLAESVTIVRAWAVRERIALRGYEPDAPTLRLRGEAPAEPRRLTDPATLLTRVGLLAAALLVPVGLSALVGRVLGRGADPATDTHLAAVWGGMITLVALLLARPRGAPRAQFTLRLATLLTGQGRRTMLRIRVSRRDPVSLARIDRLIAALPTGPISVSRLAPRRGQSCAALTIAPPLAGWPPIRPRSRDRALLTAYQAACAGWLTHLQREVDEQDLRPAPWSDALAQARASQVEQQLVAALRQAGLPVEIGCAVPIGSSHPDAQYVFYWPDAAIRDAAAWLLVDVEYDGSAHREQQREWDRRRDLRFRRRGWYVARIDLEAANGRWPLAVAHDLTRLVHQHHEAVLTAKRARHVADAQTLAP